MADSKALAKLLGIELPIIQAPMAGVSTVELAAAVSNAGGLGSLAVGLINPRDIGETVEKLRAATSKPFNLNFFVHHEPDLAHYDARPMQNALMPFYAELGLGAVPEPKSPAPAFNDETLAIVLRLRPHVVSFHFGLPSEAAMKALKQARIVILGCATVVAEAHVLERGGADAIIAQGYEAGGHRGTFLNHVNYGNVGTMALVPQIADAVRVPVIAAGGIGDARGIAAAFMLGASAVQLGTAYMACPEVSLHPLYRKALAEASDHATLVTSLFSGRPARTIRNRLTEELTGHEKKAAPYPAQRGMIAPLSAASARANRAEFMQLFAGQAASLARPEPAAAITTQLMAEANALMKL